jgi:hypothetical protein
MLETIRIGADHAGLQLEARPVQELAGRGARNEEAAPDA